MNIRSTDSGCITQPSSTPDNGDNATVFGCIFAAIVLFLTSAAAWATHVVACISLKAWILLAFGCVVAPVGVIHGIGIWLGLFAW